MASNKQLAVNVSTGAIVAPITSTLFRSGNGLAIGVNIQAWSADLDSLVSNVTWTGDRLNINTNVLITPDDTDVGLDIALQTNSIGIQISANAGHLQNLIQLSVDGTPVFEVLPDGLIKSVGVAVPTISSSSVLTNKTLTAPDINGGTADALTSLSVVNQGTGVFDMAISHNGTLTDNRLLIWNLNDVTRNVSIAGDITTGAAFTTSGAFDVTLTATGGTNVTLPTTGTLYATGGTDVAVADGGTGASTALAAKTNLGFGTITKTSDETRTSTTVPAADSMLLFPVEANANYKFRFWVVATAESATPNFEGGLSGPASPTSVFYSFREWAGGVITGTQGARSGYGNNHPATLADNTLNYIIEIQGNLRNGANAGNVSFIWAQDTSSSDDLTIKGGSFVEWEKTN